MSKTKLKEEPLSKREFILEEAAKLFVAKGYKATSMKDIAATIGVEAASLYNHIKNKQEILVVLLGGLADRFSIGIHEILITNASSGEKLEEAIRMHIQVSLENRNKTHLILEDWKHLEEPEYTRYLTLRKEYQDLFKGLVLEGIKSGFIKKGNPELILNNILSSVRSIYNQYLYSNTSEVSKKEYEENIIDFIFNGIGNK